jgi:hypothetical protein
VWHKVHTTSVWANAIIVNYYYDSSIQPSPLHFSTLELLQQKWLGTQGGGLGGLSRLRGRHQEEGLELVTGQGVPAAPSGCFPPQYQSQAQPNQPYC